MVSQPISDLNELLALVGERSNLRRRELLRRLTDVYVATPAVFDDRQTAILSDILSVLAREMEMDVRRTLATAISRLPVAPRGITLELAKDEIAVAGPILRDSLVLSDADLAALARIVGQEHLAAIARRAKVSSLVSDAVAQRAEDDVLVVLAENAGADLPRSALEIMIARVADHEHLGRILVSHPQLPPDLLNGLYFIVSASLRRVIIDRTDGLDPEVVESAIRESEQRVRARMGLIAARSANPIDGDVTEQPSEGGLVRLAREGKLRQLATVLGKLADLPPETTDRLLEDVDQVGLAVVCRACRFELQTFTAIAMACNRETPVVALVSIYQNMPAETASRIVRFWRVRRLALSSTASSLPQDSA